MAEKLLPAKCKPRTLAYCPTMDLIALATVDDEVRVFRLNGQQVFGASFGGDDGQGDGSGSENGGGNSNEVREIAWKGNGRFGFL